jgi:hypothetical protein
MMERLHEVVFFPPCSRHFLCFTFLFVSEGLWAKGTGRLITLWSYYFFAKRFYLFIFLCVPSGIFDMGSFEMQNSRQFFLFFLSRRNLFRDKSRGDEKKKKKKKKFNHIGEK